jgi:predicted nucleic acid-binding protein
MAVFLDTVGLVALWDRADQWHSAADAAFQRIAANGTSYVTTPFILAECGNAAARKPFRQRVVALEKILAATNGIETPTELDWRGAWHAYERGVAGNAGIVDCISFAVMRRLGLTEAFTNDQHFAAAGFTPLF